MSVKDQMAFMKKHWEKNPRGKVDHAAVNAARAAKSAKRQKETDKRTDDEKMADATGPRKGSNYRGD